MSASLQESIDKVVRGNSREVSTFETEVNTQSTPSLQDSIEKVLATANIEKDLVQAIAEGRVLEEVEVRNLFAGCKSYTDEFLDLEIKRKKISPKYNKNQTEKETIQGVTEFPEDLCYVENQTTRICIAALEVDLGFIDLVNDKIMRKQLKKYFKSKAKEAKKDKKIVDKILKDTRPTKKEQKQRILNDISEIEAQKAEREHQEAIFKVKVALLEHN